MILEYSRAEGLKTIEGQVLRENVAMLAMCRELGFVTTDPNDGDVWLVRKNIAGQAASSS
jgi:acetyltransferase